MNSEIKDYVSYADLLNEDIEKILNKAKIIKSYIPYIVKQETIFDKNSSSFACDTNTYYDDYIRRKKNNNIIMNEDMKLEDVEILKDLHEIFNDDNIQVRVLDTSLYISDKKFTKNDKVVVIDQDEEYVGTITSVDYEGVIIKGKDCKKNRIHIENIKSLEIKLVKYLKK